MNPNWMLKLKKSIAAGVLIGLAGALYVNMEGTVTAAFLFAFALFFICLLGLDLFTGKIGWFGKDGQPWTYYLEVFIGNMIGVFAISMIILLGKEELQPMANALIEKKAALAWYKLLCRGFGCGILMYLAVACFKKGAGVVKYLGIFLAIPVFILSGFEHSIADMAYLCLAMRFDFIPGMLVVALGNALGSISACALMENKPAQS